MEAIEAYKKGGLQSFSAKTSKYLSSRVNSALLFNPYVPPISISHKCSSFPIGYRDKYIYCRAPPKVVPEPTDTVVEAGVHHGHDTAMFGKLADQVIGFEPSPRNYKSAEKNLRRFSNITLINAGLWNETGEMEIQYGNGTGDDGFLDPDSKGEEVNITVPVTTIKDYVQEESLSEINFLKIEAEGAEPEIIDGIGDLRPEKIVVNADEERDGKSPGREIMNRLQSEGYNLVAMTLGCVLFFVLDTEYHYAFRKESI